MQWTEPAGTLLVVRGPARPLNAITLSLKVRTMKYDDASWHTEGKFPSDLPEEAAATHCGIFLAWALLHEVVGEEHAEDFADDLNELRSRGVTPGAYLMHLDGKFTDEELSEEGNAFASSYFALEQGQYIKDYEKVLANGLPSSYHVADTWENFDRLQPTIDKRFKKWQSKQG